MINPIRPALDFFLAVINLLPQPFIAFWYLLLGIGLASAVISLFWRLH